MKTVNDRHTISRLVDFLLLKWIPRPIGIKRVDVGGGRKELGKRQGPLVEIPDVNSQESEDQRTIQTIYDPGLSSGLLPYYHSNLIIMGSGGRHPSGPDSELVLNIDNSPSGRNTLSRTTGEREWSSQGGLECSTQ